jgi:NADPH:quinone reductase-like Zn-dependent oxidoreductase
MALRCRLRSAGVSTWPVGKRGYSLMRVFVAGASGVIGLRLLPLLVAAGHEVAAMTRSPGKLQRLRDLGAEPVLCDAFDADALREMVVTFQPEAVVNELTDLPDQPAARNDANARLRREGTRNLLAAAKAAGAPHFVARALPGSYRAKRVQRSANSSGSYSAPTASFSAMDGCTGLAPTTRVKSRRPHAFTSTRPLGAPCRHLTQLPGSS